LPSSAVSPSCGWPRCPLHGPRRWCSDCPARCSKASGARHRSTGRPWPSCAARSATWSAPTPPSPRSISTRSGSRPAVRSSSTHSSLPPSERRTMSSVTSDTRTQADDGGARRRDVLVVGAGPVGLTAALALRAYGLPVTVLEAGREGRQRPGSRAIFTHSQTLQILDRISPGLGAELYEHGVYWNTQRTFFAGKEVYAKTYPDPPAGSYPHFTSLPQVQIEAYLFARAVASGVD